MKKEKAVDWIFTLLFLLPAAAKTMAHLFAGDKVEPLFPLIFLALLSVSYAFWHKLEEAAPTRIS